MIYANQPVIELFGRSLKELSDMGPLLFDKFVYPEDRPRFNAHINELLAAPEGHVAEIIFRLLNANGEPKWLRTRRTIYKWDGQGKPTHVISISQDISVEIELKEINQRLTQEKRRLENERELEVVRAVLSKQEDEHSRIAESLHNGLGQLLYGVKLSLVPLKPTPIGEFNSRKNYALELLENGIIETRRISHQLMPTILSDFGLKAAIEDTYRTMNSGISFTLQMTAQKKVAPKYIELAIFRIVQELILNVCKHSEGKNCHIKLEIDDLHVQVCVSDNGKGLPDHRVSEGIGLRSIRDKISLLKGKMEVYSQPGETTIKIIIPYRHGDD